ncbi:PiT family inorganic phosphate transporter [Brevibacterium sanguinis]|uniref:Phosphate transporter n=2 Tax=Brevibacterium TaxID=1696 RepID=A0A366ILP5_9MICO|nr:MULTISPECIES: inorganic phosphate transporter [Brevibacterium]RBP65713.1 PiT family inorganic phosphate transporter [Brevibacterium sanguinis]RBP72347.1 PiT family inorganic phosphate transporter [Brevibacterium celere]
MEIIIVVVLVVTLALFFDFTNGFHDTANAMATPIATGAIKPKAAVTLAALLNLVGAFLSTEVAKTISGGIIKEGGGGVQITPGFILAGLIGAIIWNMTTWRFGLPSSSSHALFGGLIGAAIVGAGFSSVDYAVFTSKVLLPAIAAPLIAGISAYLCTRLAYAITRRQGEGRTAHRGPFKYGQIFSSSLVALAHGTNDAQKTMGVITLVLVSASLQEPGTGPHLWVIVTCAVAIAAGTYVGGWRIIDTLGTKLTTVKPAQGLSAETSTAAAILASSHLGFALSTTQVASGSVLGSGLGRKGADVRWSTAGRIASGWLLTIPAAGIVGGLAALIAHTGMVGIVIDTIIAVIVVLWIYLSSRKVDETDISNLDTVAEAVNIRGRKRKLRKDRNRKRAESKRIAARTADAKAQTTDTKAQTTLTAAGSAEDAGSGPVAGAADNAPADKNASADNAPADKNAPADNAPADNAPARKNAPADKGEAK